MNKIFKVIWNKTTQRLEVVSELAKVRGKAKSSVNTNGSIETTEVSTFRLKALTLSIFSAFGLLSSASFAADTSNATNPNDLIFGTSQNGIDNVWGTGNHVIGQEMRSAANREKLVITGVNNQIGEVHTTPGSTWIYGNRADDSNTFVAPEAVNIYGRNNLVNAGNRVNVFGNNNQVKNTAVANMGPLVNLNAFGNNITATNPRSGTFVGNNINVNSASLGLGNDITVNSGGMAVGSNLSVT